MHATVHRLLRTVLALYCICAGAQGTSPEFVPDAVCAGCHASEFEAWRGSHHDLAMQVASEETVLGDFNDSRFELFGVTTRFFRKDGEFFVNTEGPDGTLRDFPIRYTFGVDPLQQYLVEFPGGRYQALTIAWDTQRKRWYSLYPDERIAPGDALHFTGVYQNWNAMCAECHSSNLQRNYDLGSDTYRTTYAEVDVGCQSCHGPGSEHVAWARAGARKTDTAIGRRGLIVDFAGNDGRYQVAQCARCHSRRGLVSEEDAHGRAFMDDFDPVTLRQELYHADGQIDGEVYVYGSFVQSRMYAAGVRCSDCHDPHTQKLAVSGDGLCTRCHQATPDPRFPGLEAVRYDAPEHHFHAPQSEGARCVSCHMPGKVYMGIDHRRDHGFRIPRPDVSRRVGTPDACTGCHDDRTPAWAAGELRKRFGEPSPSPHFAEAIAAGREGRPGAAKPLVAVAGDATAPAIVRATALQLLGAYGQAGGGVLARALSDPEPLVRLGALRALESLPVEVRVAGASRLIEDPVRAVRSQAAQQLSAFPQRIPEPLRAAYRRAVEERMAALRSGGDLPSGRLALARQAEVAGNDALAETHYRKALDMDPRFLPARFNLATLLNRGGRNTQAEGLLRDGLVMDPAVGDLHYSLGLLLAEEERYADSATALGQAAARLPGRARVHYNHALALMRAGRDEDGAAALNRVLALDPANAAALEVLAMYHFQRKEWVPAEELAVRLARVSPQSRSAAGILRQVQTLRRHGAIP